MGAPVLINGTRYKRSRSGTLSGRHRAVPGLYQATDRAGDVSRLGLLTPGFRSRTERLRPFDPAFRTCSRMCLVSASKSLPDICRAASRRIVAWDIRAMPSAPSDIFERHGGLGWAGGQRPDGGKLRDDLAGTADDLGFQLTFGIAGDRSAPRANRHSSSAAVLRCPRNGVVRRHRLHAGICVRDRSQVPAALRQASESFPELGDQRNRYTGPALDVLNRRLIFD